MVFFDMETSGLDPEKHEVLSVSWSIDGGVIETRYYFPQLATTLKAIEINGLTNIEIRRRRTEQNRYYKHRHFVQDEDVQSIFKRSNDRGELFVAHNVKFDSSFLPFEIQNQFCTMFGTQDELNLPPAKGRTTPKYPKLSEACEFYKIEWDEDRGHNSNYDVDRLIELFWKIRDE